MKPYNFLACAALAVSIVVSPATLLSADDPLGLTLAELRAIRRTNQVKANWFPTKMSEIGRTLLLQRSESEVHQIVLYPEGKWCFRGLT